MLPLTPGQPSYVQVLPYSTVGRYKISVTPQQAYDTFEPNDTLLTPAAAKLGTDIDAGVMDNKDPDFYRFSGAPARMVKVMFENLSTTLRPYLRVYDGNKSMILERFDGTPGANLNFDVDIKQSRDFYIEVNPYSTSGQVPAARRLTPSSKVELVDVLLGEHQRRAQDDLAALDRDGPERSALERLRARHAACPGPASPRPAR